MGILIVGASILKSKGNVEKKPKKTRESPEYRSIILRLDFTFIFY